MESQVNRCWICGGKGKSAEHKIKASLLKRAYGKKYIKKKILYFLGKNKGIEIESYKSKELLFPKIICENCNNTVTRPHDDAYDIFVKYIETNYDYLIKWKTIDFRLIYGIEWQFQKMNLYKYFAKHAGCKIASSNITYDLTDLSEFISGENLSNTLFIHFQLNEGLKLFIDKINEGRNKVYTHLYNGSVCYFGPSIHSISYCGWSTYQWISNAWIVSPYLSDEKQSDFNLPCEPLSIKYLTDNNSLENLSFDELLSEIEFFKGGYEEQARFFRNMII